MKVGIITFHRADNYGAILQNYALQAALRSYGADALTIDYRTEAIERGYRTDVLSKRKRTLKDIISALLDKKKVKSLLRNLLNHSMLEKRRKRFQAFRQDYLQLSGSVTKEELPSIEQEYDLFLCGSDQIWNEQLIAPEDIEAYTLGFVKERHKSSYAVSAGSVSHIGPEALEWIRELDHITVREDSLAYYLENELRRNVEVVCDPVFLLLKEDWGNLIGTEDDCEERDERERSSSVGNTGRHDNTKRETCDAVCEQNHIPNKGCPHGKRNRKYIFLYYVDDRVKEETWDLACEIHRDLDMKVIYLVRMTRLSMFKGQCSNDAGPIEFLQQLVGADMVVASSFHAVAFSIIFHKKFVTLLPPETGSRIRDLLSKLGLSERIIADLDDYRTRREELLKNIDYSYCDAVLHQWREQSSQELRNICKEALRTAAESGDAVV